jgi:hypothetical protein
MELQQERTSTNIKVKQRTLKKSDTSMKMDNTNYKRRVE